MPALKSAGEKDFAGAIQDVLIEQMGIERFRLWFGRGVSFATANGQLTVLAESNFTLDRIRRRHAPDIRRAALRVLGSTGDVQYQLDENLAAEANDVVPATVKRETQRTAPSQTQGSQQSSQPARAERGASGAVRLFEQRSATPQGVRQTYRMAPFCVGDCNRLAYTAAQMVATDPGSASPVFLWGPSGTGKTHLLEAVRHELRSRHRLRRVIMMTAEEFTNDFMVALRGSGLPGFRRRYRDVDALMLDDVQFFKGKQATARELLYTFDTLQKSGRQLLFAADRPPNDLQGVGRELVGRLAGGMVCGLSPLDEEVKETFLRRSFQQAGLDVADDVPTKLAQRLAGDARLLSGSVNRLRAIARIESRKLTWDDVVAGSSDLIAAGRRAIDLGEVEKAVCQAFNLPAGALQKRDQQRCFNQPRMLAMYLARKHTRAPLSEIGQYFGRRSHSTVIAARRRVDGWLEKKDEVERNNRLEPIESTMHAIENLLRA